MAIYLGNTLVTPNEPNLRLWWGVGKNPKFLYETTYTNTLANTNYDSLTHNDTQRSVTFPATTFTASANANVIFDAYGTSYHNGEILDLRNYDYYILADYLIHIYYTIDEATMGLAHLLKYTYTCIMPLYLGYVISGNNVNYSNTATTFSTTYYGAYRNWYRTAANALSSFASTYGYYITPATPTYSSSGLTISLVNFRTPTLYFRSYSSYHNISAFDSVNSNTSFIKLKLRLYKTEKIGSYWSQILDRQAYIYNNDDFPTELI